MAGVPASLRRLVVQRAQGRCEYCLTPERAHFRLDGTLLVPQTPTGRATAHLLELNHPDRLAERELLILAGVIRPPEDV